MARTLIPTTDVTPTKATLTTSLTGSQNDLLFTAKKGGAWGNSIQVEYLNAGASQSLAVTVRGFVISVTLETDGSSVIQSKAAEVMAAIVALVDAAQLVDVENAPANDGTGLVTALAATALAGGAYGISQPALTNGDATNDHYLTGNDGDVILEVVSTDAGAQTVTLHYAARALGGGVTTTPEVYSVAAGATRILGPFPTALFNQNAAGDVYFDPSVSSTLDFRAYRVARAT